jgi:translation initiation factor 4G
MSVTIRRGAPSDADFLAWVMLEASRGQLARGLWDLVIDGDDIACLDYLRRLTTAEPKSLCHCESFWIAEVDGRPASSLCTYKFADGAWTTVSEAESKVHRQLGWTEADVAASEQRIAPLWTCVLPDAGADWCIEFVATLPEYRRRGLIDVLMREAVAEGVARGCTLAQISIFIGNDPAQRAYQKAGFIVHDERRSPELEAALGTPGFRRLLRKL